MKKTILLVLLIISTGAVSSSSKKSTDLPLASFNKTTTAFKRDLGNAD